jgi:hypothetical protein
MAAVSFGSARARPDVATSLPWRCSRCGTEGETTKGLTAQDTLERMHFQHSRMAAGCQPRFLVAVCDGYVMQIDFARARQGVGES